MIAKIRIWVCPAPGCATVGKNATSGCPKHPTRALIKEVYEHRRDGITRHDAFDRLFREFGK